MPQSTKYLKVNRKKCQRVFSQSYHEENFLSITKMKQTLLHKISELWLDLTKTRMTLCKLKRGIYYTYIKMQRKECACTPEITRRRDLNPIKIFFISALLYTPSSFSSLHMASSISLINMVKGSVPTPAEVSTSRLEYLKKGGLTFSWSWYKTPARETFTYVETLSCQHHIIWPRLPHHRKNTEA